MMSKTHIAIGTAVGLALAPAGSIEACIAGVIGGSVGGIMADCDIAPSKAHRDAFVGRVVVVAVVVAALAVDYLAGVNAVRAVGESAGLQIDQNPDLKQLFALFSLDSTGVTGYLLSHLGWPFVAGVLLFVVLTFVGGHTDHRSFTHSLVGMAAFCVAMWLICAPVLPFFAAGYASHLILDITNKQGIQLFWPIKKSVSLGLCEAKGLANGVLMIAGIGAVAVMLASRVGMI